jgi:hypothetical protein
MALVVLSAGLVATSPPLASTTKAAQGTSGRQALAEKRAGAITIEYWIVMDPDQNGLSTLMNGCFKITGALQDQGGAPNWTGATYLDTTTVQLKDKCGTWLPIGGGMLQPGAKGTLTSGYTYKVITGQRGSIFISFAGTVDKKMQATGKWQISGGTGAYAGLQGAGTATCDLSHFPYDRHTETGRIWWLPTS